MHYFDTAGHRSEGYDVINGFDPANKELVRLSFVRNNQLYVFVDIKLHITSFEHLDEKYIRFNNDLLDTNNNELYHYCLLHSAHKKESSKTMTSFVSGLKYKDCPVSSFINDKIFDKNVLRIIFNFMLLKEPRNIIFDTDY
jgi:hypothetical protein